MAIDINDIKTQFKSIYNAANTTTADYDLSTGLTNRVQKVLSVHPLKIPIQPSFYPYVTLFSEVKNMELATIAKNQLAGRRRAEIEFSVVGGVYDNNISDVTSDDSDDEIETLMENIEEVLRRNFKLNDTCKWTKPIRTTFGTYQADEETITRVGLMTFIATIDY